MYRVMSRIINYYKLNKNSNVIKYLIPQCRYLSKILNFLAIFLLNISKIMFKKIKMLKYIVIIFCHKNNEDKSQLASKK